MVYSFFDVGLALVFGVIGYLMRYYGYPMYPVMIALILGPIAEQNFCRVLMISHGSFTIFFKSPIFDLTKIVYDIKKFGVSYTK
jgi:putative tricarboxylic transport membrane protein